MYFNDLLQNFGSPAYLYEMNVKMKQKIECTHRRQNQNIFCLMEFTEESQKVLWS